jgi:hypothetical protein
MKPKLILMIVVAGLFLSVIAGSSDDRQTWKSIDLHNELITVEVVPKIGGRIIQFKLGDYGFFWVNQELAGIDPPVSGLGPNDSWLNYGGDKLWIAPQGWENDQQWPGPPDAVLDGGPYSAKTSQKDGKIISIELASAKDDRSGVQLSRTVKIEKHNTRVSFRAKMTNIDSSPRRWGIWSHTQLDAGNRHGEGYNPDYWGYCPLNPKSLFLKGYDVLFGLVRNSSYIPDYDKGLMQVHYLRRVGKIGLDSDAGWIATVDATDGYVFIQRFNYEPDKPYPDNSSVEFWMNGLGEFVAWGKVNKMPENPKENPYIFESEMIAPFESLEPGQSCSFEYEWYAAKIEKGLPVMGCCDVGVICKPFSAELRDNKIFLSGSFGVFYEGHLGLIFCDENGEEIAGTQVLIPVTPLKEVNLLSFDDVIKPKDARQVALHIYDVDKKFVGELARTQIVE